MMKRIMILATILLSSKMAMASQCDNPLMVDEFCFKMRHLRSQVMGLGAQRELMQVNYPYLAILGKEVLSLANQIDPAKAASLGHPEGLENLKTSSQNLITLAEQQDPLALAAANTLQKKCASCHTQSGRNGGHSWDKIFKHDWDQVSKNCSREGRVPYLCKSMNGMLSAYATVLTGPNANQKNFEAVQASAQEIARIASDLKTKNLFHGSEEMMTSVETTALLAAKQARELNEEAHTTAQEITNGCMDCHAHRTTNFRPIDLKLKPL